MNQHERDFQTGLERLTALATEAGARDTIQVLLLMATALAITDRAIHLGCSRETFLKTAGMAWDTARRSLGVGASG